MSPEYKPSSVEPVDDGKWHADGSTLFVGSICVLSLAISALMPDYASKSTFAGFTIGFCGIDSALLFKDAIAPLVKKGLPNHK